MKNVLKSNNGYMLVEIIMASAIAFLIAYFAIDLTLKIKEKNDDLYYQTLVSTDQSIITNGIMSQLKNAEKNADGLSDFSCKLTVDSTGTILSLNGNFIDNVNQNAKIIDTFCKNDKDQHLVSAKVNIRLDQNPDKDYSVNINYKYQIPRVTFTFEVLDVKTDKNPGGVNYTIQTKSGDSWVDTNIKGVTIANRTFTASLDANKTYRVKTEGGGYPLRYSHEFSSGPSDDKYVKILIYNGSDDEIVIVVYWKELTDLDAHLIVSNGDSNNYSSDHLCWQSPSFYERNQTKHQIRNKTAVLDVDNIDVGTRIETISVKRDAFDFDYLVHNFGKFCLDYVDGYTHTLSETVTENIYDSYIETIIETLTESLYCNASRPNDDRYMKVGDPTVDIIDGGGVNGVPKYYKDIKMPDSCVSGYSWHVFNYDKSSHTVKIVNTCF